MERGEKSLGKYGVKGGPSHFRFFAQGQHKSQKSGVQGAFSQGFPSRRAEVKSEALSLCFERESVVGSTAEARLAQAPTACKWIFSGVVRSVGEEDEGRKKVQPEWCDFRTELTKVRKFSLRVANDLHATCQRTSPM